MVNSTTSCRLGNVKKSTTWIANRRKSFWARPIKSDVQAQNTRPAALKIDSIATMKDARTALMEVCCCERGEAWLRIIIPADVLSESIAHNSQKRRVLSASETL